MPDIIFKNKKP